MKPMPGESDLPLTIHPLTPDLWPAFEDLFGNKGACNGCWCMYWRIGAAYRQQPREQNKTAFHEIVKRVRLPACSPSMANWLSAGPS